MFRMIYKWRGFGRTIQETVKILPDLAQSGGDGTRGRQIRFKPPNISKYFLILDLNGHLLLQDEGVKVCPKPYVVGDGVGSSRGVTGEKVENHMNPTYRVHFIPQS
jgi:hypothetical protein